MADDGPVIERAVSQNFKLVLYSVLGLTISGMVTSIGIGVFVPEPSEQAKGVLNVALTIWQIGSGAVIGLLGGKALQ